MMTRPSLVPSLSVRGAAQAIAFYEEAFGAREVGPRITTPDGKIAHTELRIGDAVFALSDEDPANGNVAPETLGGSTVRLEIAVDDADRVAERARSSGAEVVIPVADQFYGYRSGRLLDPFGHLWVLSELLEELSQEEMQRRADALFGGA